MSRRRPVEPGTSPSPSSGTPRSRRHRVLVILADPVFTSHAGPFGRSGPARQPPAIAPAICRRLISSSSATITTITCSRLRCGCSGRRRRTSRRSGWLVTLGGRSSSSTGGSRRVSGRRKSPACPRSTSPRARRGIATGRSGAASSCAWTASRSTSPPTRVYAAVQGDRRALSVDRRCLAPHRRLRAAPGSWRDPHEPRGSCPRASRRPPAGQHRDALRDVPAHRRGIDEPIRALERAREKEGVSAEAFRKFDFGESVILF